MLSDRWTYLRRPLILRPRMSLIDSIGLCCCRRDSRRKGLEGILDGTRKIVLSVKPRWMNLIMSGRKTVELRRRFPMLSGAPVTALLYSSAPVMAIVGSVHIEDIVVLPPDQLWRRVADQAGVSEDQYRAYFGGAVEASALFLGTVKVLPTPIPLGQLRSSANFTPPISWRRAKPAELELVRELL